MLFAVLVIVFIVISPDPMFLSTPTMREPMAQSLETTWKSSDERPSPCGSVEYGRTLASGVATIELAGVRGVDRLDVVIEQGAASASFGDEAGLSVEFGGSAFEPS